MKKIIYTLIIVSAVYLSSCQKDVAVAPETQSPTETTAVAPTPPLTQGSSAATDTVVNNDGFIKIELAKDLVNKDNIIIEFNPGAKASYVPGEDAPHFQGFGPESLSSISSDNISLAVNVLPLKQQGNSISLDVIGKVSACYSLSLITVDSIPAKYHVWVTDKLKNDSLDLTLYKTYLFDINIADTTTFGKNRFKVKIRK